MVRQSRCGKTMPPGRGGPQWPHESAGDVTVSPANSCVAIGPCLGGVVSDLSPKLTLRTLKEQITTSRQKGKDKRREGA